MPGDAGAQDLQELRRHPFFRGIDWDTLWTQHGPSFAELDLESMGSVSSSFDWELQVQRGCDKGWGCSFYRLGGGCRAASYPAGQWETCWRSERYPCMPEHSARVLP